MQLKSSCLTVKINSTGAEVCSVKDKSGVEFIWQADQQIWPRHAPVLFPIVGKLKNNTFSYEKVSYVLGQHGFARDRSFELVESTGSSCIFQLVSDSETKKMYPFDFVFQIMYVLKEDTLTTEYKITNPSQQTILFSVGAHPGFNCPLLPGEKQEDYFLEFEGQPYELTHLSGGLRTEEKTKLNLNNNRLFLSEGLFENDALVFENSQINTISLCSSKSDLKITLNSKNWPYFGIWSKPGAPFVCLEPWFGIADKINSTQQLNEKDGMLQLAPEAVFGCEFSIIFR